MTDTATFDRLGLPESICRALATEGYETPTPIQAQAIPHIAAGRDVLGCAQTGTGKTAAFALPILQLLMASSTIALREEDANAEDDTPPHRQRGPRGRRGRGRQRGGRPQTPAEPDRGIRALILSPTRELAAQIGESFRAYGRHTGLRRAVIFGGVGQHHQVNALKRGVDILVATPGRLLDLMDQGYVDLDTIDIFVLDEADRMLDMGFLPDIRRIVDALPEGDRQTLLFSATMPPEIARLAGKMLRNPVNVTIDAVSKPVDRIAQSVYFVDRDKKIALLAHILQNQSYSRALVFTRTKHGADKVVKKLSQTGIDAAAIHGNKSQPQRTRTLEAFRSGKTGVLVATDIAARGIDVDDITFVINFDLTDVPETYVHRIGRTARAGADGRAMSFCDFEERPQLTAIERLTKVQLEVVKDHPYPASVHHKPSPKGKPSHDAAHPNAGKKPDNRRRHKPGTKNANRKKRVPHPGEGGTGGSPKPRRKRRR